MNSIIAVAGAITNATRLAKELEREGCLKCRVIRTPLKISSGGCSYSVKAAEECLSLIFAVSRQKNIRLKGIFRETVRKGGNVYEGIS